MNKLILSFFSIYLLNNNDEVYYKNRESISGINYREGVRDEPIEAPFIELIGAIINENAFNKKDKIVSAKFFLPNARETTAHLILREREFESYYRLDKVQNEWQPGLFHDFRWKSDVLSILEKKYPRLFKNLIGMVRMGVSKPSLSETVAPVYLSSLPRKKRSIPIETIEVAQYSFIFKLNFIAKIRWRILFGEKEVGSGVVVNQFSGHPTPIRVNVAGWKPGKYRLEMTAIDQVRRKPHHYSCRFYHVKSIKN